MKKIVFCIMMIFMVLNVIAQNDCYTLFKNEGITYFTQGKYQKALNNYQVANDCEDKPNKNDILKFVAQANSCKQYKEQGEKAFHQKKYKVAEYMFNNVIRLNPDDKYCVEMKQLCLDILSCYPESYIQAENFFKNSDYISANKLFNQANNCKEKPEFHDALQNSRKSTDCLKYRQKADSLFERQRFEKSIFYYTKVLNINPYDIYCRKRIESIPPKGLRFMMRKPRKNILLGVNYMFRNIGFFYDKIFQAHGNYWGLTYAKLGKFGYYANFLTGYSKIIARYSFQTNSYLTEKKESILYDRSQIGFTPVKESYAIESGNIILGSSNNLDEKLTYSLTLGLIKRIVDNDGFKLYFYAGTGLADWGLDKKSYEGETFKMWEYAKPKLQYTIDANEAFNEVSVYQYYINVPQENAYSIEYKNGICIDFGLIFTLYKYSASIGMNFIPGNSDKFISNNQAFVFGLSYIL